MRPTSLGDRAEAIDRFLALHGWAGAERRPLAGDASFRRYERVARNGLTAVVMDAPPPQNDVRPFVAIARVLAGLDLSAPRVDAVDEGQGLLLLEDLGDMTYGRALATGADEGALYRLAIDVLIALHRRFRPTGATLPAFDDARALREVELVLDWYWPALKGETVSKRVRESYRAAWRAVLPDRDSAPSTLALFDYHIDNLMWLPKRDGVKACGLLDFQDAIAGPVSFDLVSLLEDARRDVPPDLAADCIDRYLAAFPALDRKGFEMSYAVIGAQRSTRILGTFARLKLRDGKPAYLVHLPRVWRWIENDLAQPALGPVRAWFDRHIPSGERRVPAALVA